MDLLEAPSTTADPIRAEKQAKAQRLDNWRPLDVHRWSDFPECGGVLDDLYDRIKGQRGVTGTDRSIKNHLRTVVTDLYVSALESAEQYVGYYRQSSQYKRGSRYYKLHIRQVVVPIVDALAECGFLEQEIGHYSRLSKGSSHMSRMRARPSLITLIAGKHSIRPLTIRKWPDTECIVLRRSDSATGRQKDAPYADNPLTKRMRRDVTAYNNLIDASRIEGPWRPATSGTGIDHTQKFTRRIFNDGNWTTGGRFYGPWWQTIPSHQRLEISVDGRPVIEWDYSGLHIVLLYGQHGIDYWGVDGTDPYTLPGYTPRDELRRLLKLVLLTAINATSRSAAKAAIQSAINLDPDEYEWFKSSGFALDSLLEDFEARHKPIAKAFYSGIGKELQYLDSRIAERVINALTKEGIPCLCIHDSFLVPYPAEGLLKAEMDRAFTEVLGAIPGLTPSISAAKMQRKASPNWQSEEKLTVADVAITPSNHYTSNPWIGNKTEVAKRGYLRSMLLEFTSGWSLSQKKPEGSDWDGIPR